MVRVTKVKGIVPSEPGIWAELLMTNWLSFDLQALHPGHSLPTYSDSLDMFFKKVPFVVVATVAAAAGKCVAVKG